MKKKILQYLYLSLFLSVVGLTAIGITVYWSIHRMDRKTKLLSHTQNVLFQSEQVISILKDAETGQRGFLVTRSPTFLAPYFTSTDSIQPCLDRLKNLVQDNPQQKERCNQIQVLADQRFFILNQVIRNFKNGASDSSIVAQMEKGKAVMDQVRSVIFRLQRAEQQLFVDRVREFKTVSTQTLNRLAVLFAGAMLLIISAFYFILRELRQRWHYELELKKTVAKLYASNAELEHFSHISSHHLQEPMRKLQTFSDRLHSKYGAMLGGDAQFLIQRISATSGQMQTLMQDLLTFVQLGKLQQEADFQLLNLAEIVQKLLDHEFAEPIAAQKAAVQISGLAPAIQGQPQQIQTLFAQLLHNSLKFAHPDRPLSVKFEFSLAKSTDLTQALKQPLKGNWVKVLVSDNGIGFDPQYKEKVFQLFQRLEVQADNLGTGVGLAICKKVMQNHQGYISAESILGQGAQFSLYFPESDTAAQVQHRSALNP